MVPLSGQNSKVEGHFGGVRCKKVGFYNFGMPAPSNFLGGGDSPPPLPPPPPRVTTRAPGADPWLITCPGGALIRSQPSL